MFRSPLKEKDGLLRGCPEEIASLKAQTERRATDFRNEQVALGEPGHIARKYFLRSHAPVGIPRVFADQMTCQDFVTQGLENF